jgi:GMP synthase (glutamine-hydrolysing)
MAGPLRFLIVDGNVRTARQAYADSRGRSPGQAYAETVAGLAPGAVQEIACPADDGANLPDGAGLDTYDGIFLTGSALNIYDGGPAIARQIDLLRTAFSARTPVFGSCWGLQVGAVAAGGTVHRNPRGRETGIARRIERTAAGSGHPLLAGRPAMWDAPCTHLDEVALPPGEMIVLARNTVSDVQAAEIRTAGTTFWGVQYHPEFSLGEVSSIMRRRSEDLLREGFARSAAELHAHLDDYDALDADPTRADLAWRLGLDAEVLDPRRRMRELTNFIEAVVQPTRSARGRA